jgi:hypothetical protein
VDFTLETAIAWSQRGRIDEWVNALLLGPGNNEALAVGLRLAERHWLGPVELPIASLERCCGPEPQMEFLEDEDHWNQRVASLLEMLESGIEFPPLVAEYRDGLLSVRDGNHRLGAMVAGSRDSAWTLVWHNSRADLDRSRRALAAVGVM